MATLLRCFGKEVLKKSHIPKKDWSKNILGEYVNSVPDASKPSGYYIVKIVKDDKVVKTTPIFHVGTNN